MTAAKRRAIDTAAVECLSRSTERLGENGIPAAAGWYDDVLRLILTACHPVQAVEGRVALTLRVAGGLTTAEIARFFLVPEKTLSQRIFEPRRHCPRLIFPLRLRVVTS
jgi:predicted RNA polymerase sigma factor